MDRAIVQPGALPQDIDVLNSNLFAMVGQAFQAMAMLGTSTVVAGLAATPTTPTADLHVTIGVGSIYAMDPIDASAYGTLPVNNNSVLKQGINPTPQVLSITPPATSGFSQVYLVQAILNDVDAGNTVLSYYNSANPALPFSGPANSGSSNFTTRTCVCAIALKAGIAASTGTQVAPSPDAGFVGLYTVTVANGQTQITSGNIAQLASAPFFPTLPLVPYQVQQGVYTYAGQDTGAANAYVITFKAGQPIPSAYVAGMKVSFKAQNANTGASTVNVNGLGAVSIRRASGVALSANDIVSGGVVELTYDGTLFQMANYLGSGANTNTTTAVSIPYVADTGSLNALIGTYSPAITSGQQVAGLALEIKLANTITGACTINVNGLGAKAVKTGDLANPPNGLFVAGEVLLLIYDGTQYQIANTTSQVYRKPAANTTLFVNGSTGSDTLYDGTSSTVTGVGTAGPFATISKAVQAAFGFAPSQFTITVQVAAGTYTENVVTPSFSGPNIIINGASASSVTVNGGNGSCLEVVGPNTMTVQNIGATQGNNPNSGLFIAQLGATLTTSNTLSLNANFVFATDHSSNINVNSHTFSGSAAALFFSGGLIALQPGAVFTFTNSISVSQATAVATGGGIIGAASSNPSVFVNPSFVNGLKFSAQSNAVIVAVGLGVNYFPGSVAGSTSTGGLYVP